MPLAKDVALKVPAVRRLKEDRDALQAEVRQLRSEAEDLRRQLRIERDDKEYSYVFIVTYGRTGSTLLQGLLNSIPGYLIRGENDGALEWMHESYRRMEKRIGTKQGSQPVNPWFGLDNYSPDEAAASVRRHLQQVFIKPEPDTRVTGFKEIRWWRRDLVETLEFTRQVFPGARFVLNTRNSEDVVRSKWWAKYDRDEALAKVADYDGRLERAHRELGDLTYPLHYDDYVADPGVFEGLFDWLGESFDREQVDRVMATRHSVG
ncbi:sulfotransferase [Aeromicrobium duanguangcaii]|uniref:sulfotransferase n=1 Tax=Aeromicrobium duanguangcaii TaxID=2968086 RepID=UPI002016D584|nr:sulfotransferase [Aeromicrobium duanguangcaii]MCL3838841.1 sulfotransferase [Aeromicrobium duanguangcaii]